MLLIAWILLLLACPVQAQLGLPELGRPLPGVDATGVLDRATGLPANASRELLELRRDAWRALLRRNRATLEAGPGGVPVRRGEILALAPSAEAVEAARKAGFAVIREQRLSATGIHMVVFAPPDGASTARALKRIRKLDPDGAYDYNHLFLRSTSAEPAESSAAPAADGSAHHPAVPARIGLIDSGVDTTHPAFASTSITQHGCGDAPVAGDHGTAVASLLVGNGRGFRGAAPSSQLYAADIYCGSESGGAADALVAAFDWLAGESVAVINVSLVGPHNMLLEAMVRALVTRGHLVVAAVGNDGPAARPLYPAAYPGVVAVAAVDARNRPLPESCRGDHVRFAAPGADMAAATPGGGFAAVRGTSFAAPLVAGSLASLLDSAAPGNAGVALAALEERALDLGRPGPDRIFGVGVVAQELRVPPEHLAD